MRFSFIVGVSSSPPGSQSPGRIAKRFTCSTRARSSLARSSPRWISAISSSFVGQARRRSPSTPCSLAQRFAASASRVSRALMYLRRSPIAIAWLTSGICFSRASMFAGERFLPAAVMISSFFRSTIRR